MYPTLNQLIDIRGLDPEPWWHLAPGWWILFITLAFLLYALPHILLAWHRRPRYPRWHRDARRQLHELRRRAGSQDAKETAAQLTELLRRIAITRFGRASCAGLVGEAWLTWLKDKDPTGFDWPTKGRPLVALPYAPPGQLPATESLGPLIDAALIWLATTRG